MLTSSSSARRWGLAIGLATLVAVTIGTQWPFDYRITEFAIRQRWYRVDWSWFPRARGGHIRIDHDLLVNLLLLVPLGAAFALWRRAAAWRIALEGFALGLVTTVTLELGQLLTRYRYTSFADVWRNTFSCVLGCVIVIAVARTLERRRAT